MKNHIDLFSGIGGFALAASWAGFKTVQFVEMDSFCQKVLQKNFPGVPIHDDIKTYSYASIEDDGRHPRREENRQEPESGSGVESGALGNAGHTNKRRPAPFILTGGFPCQPFSCAGKRKGKEDDRYLWPEMLRVISEARPTWVIGENVGGFVNMGLDDCISDLETEGYEVQLFIIPACAKNAPHRRDRVWIVAHARCAGQEKQEQQAAGSEQSDSDAPDTSDKGLQGRERGEAHGERQTSHGSVAECGNAWSEPWLEVATRLCRVDDGIPRRVDRLKSLGNAIVPQIAYEFMKNMES